MKGFVDRARNLLGPATGGGSRLGRATLGALSEAESLYRSLRPWLLLREEDAVLIVPPNRVYKLGGSASAILAALDAGLHLRELPDLDEGRSREVLSFFDELSAACEGRASSSSGSPGRVPYDFSFTRLPVLGELAITYRCNERCKFCYAGCGDAPCRSASSDGGDAEAGELPTAELKRVIRVFREEAKIPFFSFTGGEPLLREDLEELASYAVSLGLRVNLITNGSLATAERAASLKAAGIDTAQVSLESPEAPVHDELCGSKGAWRRTVDGIRALREAGLSVQTNSTVTRDNMESLRSLPALLRELGVSRFSMNLFIPSGRGLSNAELFVGYSEIGPFVDAMRREAHRGGLTFFWYSPTPYCIYNPVARGMGNKSCAAMDGLLHVNPEGDVLPCSSWPERLGNLVESKFSDIWFSERAAYFKNKRFAPAACAACRSFVACQGACPLYWKEVGTAELEEAEARHRAKEACS